MSQINGAHTVPATDPTARYPGTDPTTTVRVEIDGTVSDVRVRLEHRWRDALSPDQLGPAVLEAFTAATTARLTAWATAGTASAPQAGTASDVIGAPPPAVATSAAQDAVDRLGRAWRDLREFGVQLAELHQTIQTASSPGRHVTATVRAGQVVAVDLDPAWRQHATNSDLESHLAAAVTAALRAIAAVPQRALERCPDLLDVLADSPVRPPFRIPPSQARPMDSDMAAPELPTDRSSTRLAGLSDAGEPTDPSRPRPSTPW